MKRLTLITFSFFFCSVLIYGQTSKGIKIYTNYFSDSYSINHTQGTQITREDRDFNSLGSMSVGYIWQKNDRKWSELEFGWAFDQSEYTIGSNNRLITAGEKMNTTMLSSRYEWQYQLLGNESVSFNLGAGTQLYWLNNSYTPMISAFFPYYSSKVSLRFAAVPRVLFHFERFALDINLPITLAQAGFTLTRVENPVLRPEERSNNGFDFELFAPKDWIQARIGIWWYL